MEHELWVNGKVFRQSEALWVILAIVCKSLAKSNEHSIQPSQHIRTIIDIGLEHSNARHENSCGFLIKWRGDFRALTISKVASNSSNSKSVLTARVLVMRNKLNKAAATRSQRSSGLVDYFKVDTSSGLGGDGTHFPCRRVTNTNFCFANACRLLVGWYCVTDQTTNLQFASSL